MLNWTIPQGETISSDGISKPYFLKITPGNESKLCKTQIVMSAVPREQLPHSMRHDGAKLLCNVESVLKGLDMKLKNRHWYSRGEKYLRAIFDIKVILGAADLKFQLQSKGGEILSRNHEAIQVKWIRPWWLLPRK